MKNRAIGIIGGSFDPVHLGHLHLALEVQESYHLSEIWFIPCHQNPLKSHPPLASAKDRRQMLELAIAPFPSFRVDLQEIQHEAPSYTVDTLCAIRKNIPDCPLALIMASDAFASFHQWKDWKQILHYAHLIIATRSGHNNKAFAPELNTLLSTKKSNHPEQLYQATAGTIFEKTLSPQPPISSTTIRHRIAHQKDISAYVPTSVKAYISTHHLYKETD